MAFRACPTCGATVHDDWVDTHQAWHDDTVEEIELEPWPADDGSRPGIPTPEGPRGSL